MSFFVEGIVVVSIKRINIMNSVRGENVQPIFSFISIYSEMIDFTFSIPHSLFRNITRQFISISFHFGKLMSQKFLCNLRYSPDLKWEM